MNDMRKLMESLEEQLGENDYPDELSAQVDEVLSQVYSVLNDADMHHPDISLNDFFSDTLKLSKLARTVQSQPLNPLTVSQVERALHWAKRDLESIVEGPDQFSQSRHDRTRDLRGTAESVLSEVQDLHLRIKRRQHQLRGGGLQVDVSQSPVNEQLGLRTVYTVYASTKFEYGEYRLGTYSDRSRARQRLSQAKEKYDDAWIEEFDIDVDVDPEGNESD